MTTLSAVVPATNRPLTLTRCLAAIQAAEEPPEEVIVVDSPTNAGPAEARNAGATTATQEVLVFIDADVVVHVDVFRKIRLAFDEDPTLVAVFGSYDDAPAAPSLVSTFRNLLHHHVHQSGAGAATTFWAGLGAIRRDAFTSVGGFDAQRFPVASVEDIDLGMRLARTAKKVVLDPTIQGNHLKRWTLTTMVEADYRRRAVPWVRLLLDQKADSTALNLSWAQRASVASTVGLVTAGLLRRRGLGVIAFGSLVTLNRRFYLLLLRRGGWRLVSAGVPLHVVHHLISAAAVPGGVFAHLRNRRSNRSA